MISLTPHPIAAERSLSQPSVLPSPIEAQPVADDTARSSPVRLSRSFILLLGFWLASVAVGIRIGGWYAAGVVTGAFAGTFVILFARRHRDWIAAFLRDVFGSIEWTLGDFCEFCRDVHACGVRCPRQISADCDVCGTVLLTASLTCPAPRSEKRNHVISKSSIHLTTEAEWRRSHLRACCELENA